MANPAIARLREVLYYEPDTGLVRWRVTLNNRAPAGAVAGTLQLDGYRRIKVDGKLLYAHRVAWALVHDVWPTDDIDHINGRPDDNRLSNLRDVSCSVNLQNQRRAQTHNKLGVLGVSKCSDRDRYRARIRIDGSKRHLGYFKTVEEASAAYLAAKRELHAGCTI